MNVTYPLDLFFQDLKTAEVFHAKSTQIYDSVCREITTALAQRGLAGEIHLVGSTDPKKYRSVIDPLSPDDRYPSDFDFNVVIPQDLDKDGQQMVLSSIQSRIGGEITCTGYRRRQELISWVERFPISILAWGNNGFDNFPPHRYCQSLNLTDGQRQNIQALRLFSMRSGVYGGFTRGFKGMALERMLVEQGDFNGVLNWLYQNLEEGKTPVVTSPLDNSNIVGHVQPDIWERLHFALGEYVNNGSIRALPYTVESWMLEHPNRFNAQFHSEGSIPFATYKKAVELTKQVVGELGITTPDDRALAVLVLPRYKASSVMISVDGLKPRQRAEFYKRLYEVRQVPN